MFYYLRINYYISRYLNELKSISEETFETMKDFRLKAGFYEENLRKAFELTKKMQLKRHNKITLTYEIYLDYLYKDDEMKSMIIKKYGMETYNIFLRAGGLEEKTSEAGASANIEIRESTLMDERVINLRQKFETSSFTQEEIESIILLVDIALRADELISGKQDFDSLIKSGTLFTLIPINIFKTWNEKGKMSDVFLNFIFEIIPHHKAETILDTRNVMLDYLNDNDAKPNDFYLLTEKIIHRKFMRKALLTIKDRIDISYIGNFSFCIRFAHSIMHHIIGFTKESLKSLDTTNEMDKPIVTGLFLFVFTNHLAFLFGLNFEVMSTFTTMHFQTTGHEPCKNHMNSIISTYNGNTTKSKFTYVLGTLFAEWIQSQSDEKLNKIFELYILAVKNTQTAGT